MEDKGKLIEISSIRLRHFTEGRLDFSVSRGETVGIAGANGAGKSSLLRYLAGLEEACITEQGMDQPRFFQPPENNHTALVFQHAEDNLIFSSLREDIRFGLRCLGRRMIETEFEMILKLFHLENAADKPYMEMSGGELERAALASIFSQKPDVLLLDEVLSSQSESLRNEILRNIVRIAKTEGMTVILASHEPEILQQCERIVHMEQGRNVSAETDIQNDKHLFRGTDPVPVVLNSYNEIKNAEPFSELLQLCKARETSRQELFGRDAFLLTEYINRQTGPACARLDSVSLELQKQDIFINLSLSLSEGALYHLTGPSGCGKSTLLRVIAGLIYVSEGEVRVFDSPFPLSGRNGWAKIGRVHHQSYLNGIRKKIGYAGQHADRQLFRGTVFEDVGFGPQNFGLSGDELKAAQVKALYRMGMDESFWQRSTSQLSIGEQRKTALAGIIATDPQLLLLDDPYAELDQDGIAALNRVILDFLEAGHTVVIAEGE